VIFLLYMNRYTRVPIYSSDPVDPYALVTFSSSTSSTRPSYALLLRPPRPPLLPDEAKTKVKAFTRFDPRPEQVETLIRLYEEKDHILVAPCGWGKMIIITGLACLVPRGITMIISPLKAIQRDQAEALRCSSTPEFPFKPFVLDGDSNTPANRRDIACGKYTHIWTSVEVVVGDYKGRRCGQGRKKRKKVEYFDDYEDNGSFSSVIHHEPCRLPLRWYMDAFADV